MDRRHASAARFGTVDENESGMIGKLASCISRGAFLSLLLALPGKLQAAEEGGSGMPQLNLEHFPPQLFWLAIILILFFFAVRGLALPRIGGTLEMRRQKIDDDLEKAAHSRQEAEAAQAAYEKALAEAAAHAQSIYRDTAQEIAASAARRRTEVALRLAEDAQTAGARIAAAKIPAMKSLQDVAGEVVLDAVAKLADTKVSKAEVAAAVGATFKETGG